MEDWKYDNPGLHRDFSISQARLWLEDSFPCSNYLLEKPAVHINCSDLFPPMTQTIIPSVVPWYAWYAWPSISVQLQEGNRSVKFPITSSFSTTEWTFIQAWLNYASSPMLQSIPSPHSISPGFSSQSVNFLPNLPPIGYLQTLQSKHFSISDHLANKWTFSKSRQSSRIQVLPTIDQAISPGKVDYPASFRLRFLLAREQEKSSIKEIAIIY